MLFPHARGYAGYHATDEDRRTTRGSWDWREVAASLVVMAYLIGAYTYFRG
jgi:hypothetical protein